MNIRHFLVFLSLVSPSLGLFVGCKEQSEGERCSLLNGNDDCEGSLVCTASSGLRDGSDGVDRCCPKAGEATVDQRCTVFLGSGTDPDDQEGDGGSSGDGDDAAGGSSDGGQSLNPGDSCAFNSDCQEPLVCGPQGICQVECRTDRDCPDGQSCVGESGAQKCE